MDEESIKTFLFPSLYPVMIILEKHNNVTPFLDVVLISSDYHAHVFVSKIELLHLCNIVSKAASVTHTFRS